MLTIHARSVLLPEGWRENVRIGIKAGRIAEILTGVEPQADDDCHAVVLPGMANVHSHAFQRGMAGLAEVRGETTDTFWSWRNLMYRFALRMSPDQMEAVASQLYMEMLEAGFTRVGEFHYLHHDRDGSHYGNIAEMAERIVVAALDTGIGLTLLPVFYAHSDFGGKPPLEGQRRFVSNTDDYARLLEGCQHAIRGQKGYGVGVAPHSLRAVTPEQLAFVAKLNRDGPVHIHVAEQTGEVDACLAWGGVRPVEFLLNEADIDERWCLIHATHMTEAEVHGVARSGATVGLCPITEANLGDGAFPAVPFQLAGGQTGIGSDSNVLIGIADELRQLEYSQRLLHRGRNLLALEGRSTGRTLFDGALKGGAAALKSGPTGIAIGNAADFFSFRQGDAAYCRSDAILDSWIFANAGGIDSVWMSGSKRVENGRHKDRARIAQRFATVMQTLLAE